METLRNAPRSAAATPHGPAWPHGVPAHPDDTTLCRFERALIYAVRAHAGQRRKHEDGIGTPYIAHPLRVAAALIAAGAEEDVVIAGLFHDLGEDQGGRPRVDDIRARFGQRVADIVAGCSDTLESPKPAWRPRKERYLAHLATASADVLRVATADKLDNAHAIRADLCRGEDVFARFRQAGRDGTLWYYRAVSNVLRRVNPGPAAEELAAAVTDIETLAETFGAPRR